MSRRRRRRSHRRKNRGSPNYWLILVQVFVFAAVLVFLIMFRDYLALSASNVVEGLSGDDLDVPAEQQENADNPRPDGQPDLETPADESETETDSDDE